MTTKEASHKDIRLSALNILLQVLPGAQPQRSLNLLIDSDPSSTQSSTHPFTQVIVYGVCRYYQIMNNILANYLEKPLKVKDRDINLILLIGCYQILFTHKAHHAVLNATTELTKKRGKKWATALVNAILRKVLKNKDILLAKTQQAQAAYPSWFTNRINARYNSDEQQHIYTNSLMPGPMTLRWNRQNIPKAAFIELLEKNQLKVHWHNKLESCLTLDEPIPVSELPNFFDGSCSVQDEAAQWAGTLLKVEPGDHILDACAAPGGKCCHLLENNPEIKVTAIDISSKRLEQVRANMQRLKLQAHLICNDAANPQSWHQQEKPFDHILLDAPCSGSGVIRRHPDILWLRRPEDIEELTRIQSQLLQNLWQILKPGGTLLYCTCSVLPEENEDTIGNFVAQTPSSSILQTTKDKLMNQCVSSQNPALSTLGVQLLPMAGRHDGFYYALLKKSAI